MDKISDLPFWRLHFDANGKLTDPQPDDLIGEIKSSGVTNLFVFSHGWGNTEKHAENLYQAMFPLIAAAAEGQLDGVGFAGVYWPSIWFPDQPTAKAPDVADAVAAGKPGAADAALSGQQMAGALKESFPTSSHADIAKLGRLVDEGLANAGKVPDDKQRADVEEFHSILQGLATPATPPMEDRGEQAILTTEDPVTDYAELAGATGSAIGAEDAQGLLDQFKKVWNGAKDGLRVFSFYEMKNRAGTVGEKGVAPILAKLKDEDSAIRVHLLGHSFGARLVSFVLKGLPSADASPVSSLLLIQGAFSHWAFAEKEDMPWHMPGALCKFEDRVHGPLVSTFSDFDWAVGKWYPRASFLSQDATQAAKVATEWGGMGSDGFQGSTPQADATLAPGSVPSGLTPGRFYRVDANAVIKDTSQSSFSGAHSDIEKPEIAALAIAAATA